MPVEVEDVVKGEINGTGEVVASDDLDRCVGWNAQRQGHHGRSQFDDGQNRGLFELVGEVKGR